MFAIIYLSWVYFEQLTHIYLYSLCRLPDSLNLDVLLVDDTKKVKAVKAISGGARGGGRGGRGGRGRGGGFRGRGRGM